MAYVAVKGGHEAIEASIERLKYERLKKKKSVSSADIESSMRGLIDQIMSESSIYDESLASIAIKQGEGSPEESVFLLRAFRSTLPRKHYSRIIESEDMNIERRISSGFKEIPGGQILGSSYDYTHRLINFSLSKKESKEEIEKWFDKFNNDKSKDIIPSELKFQKVLDYLRKEKIMEDYQINNNTPKDITKESLSFPSSRSERLQILTRGQTGAVTALGYASLRGFGSVHPTIGELRVGNFPVYIDSPLEDEYTENNSYYIGEFKATEVESIITKTLKKPDGTRVEQFEIGYGVCFGQNETKAIAMSILDRCLEIGGDSPTHNEEFVLFHIDSVESTGFISHLKLPHYVTFQSKLDSVRKTRRKNNDQ
ncbi:MAG: carbon-phosphorus lyase complex subunit PhnI [Eubacteriales bacterium]